MTNLIYDTESPELPDKKIIEKMEAVASKFEIGGLERSPDIPVVPDMFFRGSAEVCLTFVLPDEICELNREHRGIDRVTDVLSFPQYEVADLPAFRIEERDMGTCNLTYEAGQITRPHVTLRDEPALLLGDIVICTERAKEQATEYGHSEEREILYLFVHGMLHLLGYDHETEADKNVMREKEELIMKTIGCAIE